jgi:hypothetical protein
MEPTTVAAQQAAIQELRGRFERGELPYDDFRRGLDAVLLARDGDECAAIVRDLPAPPLAALDALDARSAAVAESQHSRIVAFMGQTTKTRRAWQLATSTRVTAVMGEVTLDLNRAELPPRARIQITGVMGTVKLYVPPAVRVSVRSRAYLGDTNLLGESVGGVVASGHETHAPTIESARCELEIEIVAVMSNVQVTLADGPAISVGELMRETLRAAAEGFRRGLQGPTADRIEADRRIT